MNWLLLLVPLSFGLAQIPDISPVILFFVSGLAIIPVAHLICEATEQIALRTGDAVGGLLNATFGNFPELIISLVALRAGQLNMVAASMIGAILANLLLAQGVSFFAGGLKYHEQEYNPNSVRLYYSMMLISVVSLAIPSAFALAGSSKEHVAAGLNLNLIIAIMLLVMYALYLVFTLKTHPAVVSAKTDLTQTSQATVAKEPHWSKQRAILTLVGASVLAAFLSEILVGSAEGTGEILGMSTAFIGLICVAVVGGAAESLSAVSMGLRNRMDLSIGISLGSSIQIALFVAPVLVILSYFIAPTPFLLVFKPQLLIFLLLSVLLSTIVAGDGGSNWYKGLQLIILYFMLAASVYLMPS